jgi:hypothetical protein
VVLHEIYDLANMRHIPFCFYFILRYAGLMVGIEESSSYLRIYFPSLDRE